MRRLANTAHSGSARTALGDDNTDYYPVPLTRAALRPGTIYADPYGHVLMVVKWLPQTADRGGLLLAVDGQPDNSISRKRFWEGTFLFAKGQPGAGPGFKRARPLIGQPPVSQPNAALTKTSAFAPYANDQGALDPETFYARIGTLINPRGLPPAAVYEETLNALVEQLNTRLSSVDTGEAFVRSHPGTVIPMPEGAKIFETIGPWEDFATPSRDMRLLIAMNVLLSLPERIVRHPELFVLAGKSPAAARTEIEALHQRLTRERTLDYKRSDLSLARITIADLLARRAAFEIAYNPNDCVERRWGAPENSPEISTCQRRAPEDQRTRMNDVRTWFRTTQRPPR